MTIDSDGNLWVAVFGGSRVLKLDGHKSETLLDTVNIQTEQVGIFWVVKNFVQGDFTGNFCGFRGTKFG